MGERDVRSALFYGMERSLKLIHETGVEKIAAYLEDLTDFLCEILPARYEVVSSRRKGEKVADRQHQADKRQNGR